MLLTRAYHEDRGETRHKVLTPDTAHGTNPATVTMAGYEVVKVGTNADGGVDVDDLRAKADDDVACLMLTNPNTLGIFDPNIEEIAEIVHGVGATLYYDGANLNAVMGTLAPGRHGLRHRPLQPAQVVHAAARRRRARAPARSRCQRPHRALPDEPADRARRDDGVASTSTTTAEKSIGRLRGFQGNYGTFVRSYAYIRSLGAEGLQDASETAVLNANYLLARLQAARRGRRSCRWPSASCCMHEFVLSGAPMKRELGIRTLDLAKRLLDHGFHPPTVYFPLLVDEALLVEPTETETQRDARRVRRGDRRDPPRGRARTRRSPATRPTRRRCAASTRRRAAKRPVIRQPL